MNNKIEFSKKICVFTFVIFSFTILIGFLFSCLELNCDLFSYIIPSVSALATASVGFYYNKAKAENLSKQKLRNILIKISLEGKISPEEYDKIYNEIENIDAVIDTKLKEMYEKSLEDNAIN